MKINDIISSFIAFIILMGCTLLVFPMLLLIIEAIAKPNDNMLVKLLERVGM